MSYMVTLGVVALFPPYCFGQQDPDEAEQTAAKHVLWIIPNFRTALESKEYKPIATKEKFRIAAQDTFDRGTFALAAAFAGESVFPVEPVIRSGDRRLRALLDNVI